MKLLKTIVFVSIYILICLNFAYGQSQPKVLPDYYRNFRQLDSIIKNAPNGIILLREVIIYPKKNFSSKSEERRFEKLERNFVKVYPTALEISKVYRNIDDSLAKFSTDKQRTQYMKIREKQIMAHYKPKLVKFTLSQSILLVKLLDRETGSTAYEIVNELKGSVKAFFWQGFAKMFGNDLKKQYDSEVKDKEIELLVKRYKEGYY